MKILVVEDDRKVAGFIEQGLREEGYAVDLAPDGDEATMLAHVYEYDLLVLDVMLPKKTGLQIAAELRREGSKTPILMLTARDATEDVVRGLDAGADDYLAKPFKFEELLARVRALVRRGGASRTELLSYGPVQVDRLKHKATVNGKRLDLTPKEFQLLEHFLLRPEDVLRRTELLEKVWDMQFDPESNVVDVHVGNLRRKLKDAAGVEVIHTVRGVGFRLATPDRVDSCSARSVARWCAVPPTPARGLHDRPGGGRPGESQLRPVLCGDGILRGVLPAVLHALPGRSTHVRQDRLRSAAPVAASRLRPAAELSRAAGRRAHDSCARGRPAQPARPRHRSRALSAVHRQPDRHREAIRP